jgi:ribonuclease BN (tRNA processing enzyme)
MRVVILGAGTAIPVPRYSPAGVYVRVAKEHILLDAGAGSLQRLARLGVRFLDLDRVFLTHFHPDHCLDLVSILFAMRIPDPARRKPLTIYGPPGLKQLYRRLNTAFQGWITPRTYQLTLKELGEATLRFNGYTVRTKRMNHYAAKAVGYRIDAGRKSLAYSGDTDVCRGVAELGRDTDLFILECSVTDARKVEGHLTPTECGRIAQQAGCRHLVLSHFYPVFQNYDIRRRVRRSFRGRLTLARDFRTFVF